MFERYTWIFKGVAENLSIPIPEGLVMDPLSPTALAVPNHIMDRIGSGLTLLREHGKKVQKYLTKNRKFEVLKKSWRSIVNVVLVEAKRLPDGNDNSDGLYCKFKLGTESHKSKQVRKSKAVWRERFNLFLHDENTLEVTVWHKVKQKNFIGRCVIDLSLLEKERTHDLWQELECGSGSLHMLITLSCSDRILPDSIPTSTIIRHEPPADNEFQWYRLDNSWDHVGQLSLTLHGAKGLSSLSLSGNVNAYCIIELDNARVQTHTMRGTSDPEWDKNFVFSINDITSTVDIAVHEESLIQSMKGEMLGKISIPLLRINNNEKRWYALKDRAKKNSARGNCPRVLLEMSIAWNPIKASMRLLRPKETKYTQKRPKFDIPLLYSNLIFIKHIFKVFEMGNDHFKRVFEWENQELSAIALGGWLIFWYFFRLWMSPLILLLPFIHYWLVRRSTPDPIYTDDESDEDTQTQKDDKTIKTRINELQDLTITIKKGIDYIVSLLERLHNLVNFSVPYISFLFMLALVGASIAFLLIPANYLFMAFGIYKFGRKFLNPQRVPNNDVLDFISRVPDYQMLKQWRELKVCEASGPSDPEKRR